MMRWQRGVAAAAAAGIAASGAEALTLRRRVRDITIPTLPTALEGLTILHISDVHAGYGPGLTLLRRVRRWAAELEPDIIAVTGDLVARRSAAPGFAAACAELVARPATPRSRCSETTISPRAATLSRRAGTPATSAASTLLDGAAIELAVERSPHLARGCIRRAHDAQDAATTRLSHLDLSADLRVLLCHFPHMLPRLEPGIAHLVLAGHLHGGQICVALAGRPHRPGASALGPDLRARGLQRHGHARLARASARRSCRCGSWRSPRSRCCGCARPEPVR